VVNSIAANSCVPAGPDHVTEIGLEPVLVIWQRHISIEVVSVPEPLAVAATLDQALPQPPPDTPPLLTVSAFWKLTKSTIRSPTLTGDVLSVAGLAPLVPFQFCTKLMATLVTWLAQDENTSWLASFGLVAKHCPAAGVVLGSVNV
jgi:hypothetical protein